MDTNVLGRLPWKVLSMSTTLGTPAMEDIPVETQHDGDTVTVTRWTLDNTPIPFFQKVGGLDGNVDRWQYYHFYAPSISVPSTSRKLRIQAGWAGQAGAVTRLPSTCALSKVAFASTYWPPAATTSNLTAG